MTSNKRNVLFLPLLYSNHRDLGVVSVNQNVPPTLAQAHTEKEKNPKPYYHHEDADLVLFRDYKKKGCPEPSAAFDAQYTGAYIIYSSFDLFPRTCETNTGIHVCVEYAY